MLGDKLKDEKLKGMVNELLDACVKITEAWMLFEPSNIPFTWLGRVAERSQ